MGAVLRYTAARLGLFAVPFAVLLYVLGTRLWLLAAAVALLVSGLASFWLLSGQRNDVASAVSGRFRRFGRQLDVDAAAEDAADEQRRNPETDHHAGRHADRHPDRHS